MRFAPSPTGPLHMGGVRTALYNYLFAKQHNGKFILRIEDTDQTRLVPEAEKYIREALAWCGISPDESPQQPSGQIKYRQSERKDTYKQYALQLINSGHAYYAFDTADELTAVREAAKKAGSPNWQYNHVTRASMKNSLTLAQNEVDKKLANGDPYVIRLKLSRNDEIKVQDQVRGWVNVNTNNMDDKVLFKADGMPTYHLANVVDDHLMEISHVIRGEEWLPSLPLHILLYRYLGWEDSRPEFAHLPLILKPDGKGKLSKRDGDRLGFPVFPIEWRNSDGEIYPGYRENGYLPEGFINMLAFLGWNPGTEQEIFELPELVENFSLAKVHKAGAKFDPAKTKWFNQQHLRKCSNSQLARYLCTFAEEHGHKPSEKYCLKVVELIKERAYLLPDLYKESIYLFVRPAHYDEKTVRKKWNSQARSVINDFCERFEKLDPFEAETIESNFKEYLSANDLGFGKAAPGLRLALTGKAQGPSLFAICDILGKEETLQRLRAALQKLPSDG